MQERKIFIDTHVHTVHSELDGMCKLEEYVKYGVKNSFPALFISDHGNISGWIPFYLLCKENNIKPVLGSEFYLSEGLPLDINNDKLDKTEKMRQENKLNFHLNLYAKNLTGYKNIIKLTTWANMENFYRKPRITFDILKEYSEGIICTTSCVGSIFAFYILNDKEDVTREYIHKFKDLFGEDFYIEYGYHKFESEKKYIEKLRRISKDCQIKTIIANDTHYMFKEDELAHKILMCKGEQKLLDKSDFDYSQNYYKSYTEICDIFSEFGGINIDECMSNTMEIINKVENYEIKLNSYIKPCLKDTNGLSQTDFLKEKIKKGLVKRYGNNIPKSAIDRVKYEMSVIEKMDFAGYFNVVSNYVNWCKDNGIPMGPGRGSGAGCLINYLIEITDVDPLKYGLIFERFLNPSRKNMPDLDLDCNAVDRGVLVQHLIEQYGKRGCVPISTRGYLKGKSSIKVVASKLGLDFNKYNKILSGIKDPSIDTVQKVVEYSDDLIKMYNEDQEFKKVVDIAKKIEGSIQSISVHASAVCLELEDISNYVPIIKTKDGFATGWTDKIVEKCGLIKYDILGLSNLSVIDHCCKMIGNNFNIKDIPLDDKKTYADLQDGDNLGKFQIESNGMKSLLKRLKPESIEHISAILALYRPGSMQFIEDYIKCKNNPNEIKYIDPRVKPILSKTYGQIIYQEQVMDIAKTLAGYTMGEADELRRAIGKKLMSEMLKHEEKFINGCVDNGLKKDVAEKLYSQIVEFAKYSFNASHSVSYAYITYQTAYLKSNYPLEYMCALLNANSDDLDKLNLYINECYRLGIRVTPPDINDSGKDFQINQSGELVFGLSAIKGLGKAVVNDIIRARNNKKFVSIEDFIERANKADKGSIQALLRVGAFNKLVKYPKRWDLLCDYINDAKNSKYYIDTENLEQAVYHVVGTKAGKKSEKYIEIQEEKRGLKSSKQDKLYREELNKKQDDLLEYYIDVVKRQFLKATTYKPAEKIQNEQELMGFNISTNPYKRWDLFKKYYTRALEGGIPYVELNELVDDFEKFVDLKSFNTVGLLTDIKELKTKKGQKMAKLTFEYFGSKTTITVFPSDWENDLEFKVQKGNMVSITGHLVETNKQYSDDDYEIRFTSMRQLNVLINENNKCIIDLKDKNIEDVNFAVKKLAYSEKSDNLPVERVVVYKNGDKMLVLQGVLWINNPDKLLNYLR